MSEWKECTIESLCKNICSGGTPNRSNDSFYQNGNIPWLNTKEVSFNRIYQTENFITELGLKSSSAKWIPANTVIVAMYGATAGRSAIAKIPLTTNQACCNLTIDEKKADYRFVYYTLFNQYSYLASMANGGAQQNLNAGMIREFKINLPDLETQTKIADVLSSLDDKIELNNQINRNLEEQAQALFKNYEGNKAYCERKICDVAEINPDSYGIKDNWSFVKYLDTSNITQNAISEIQYIDLTVEKLPSRAKRKVVLNDIIYSTVRPNQRHYGIIGEVKRNMLVSTGFTVIRSKNALVSNEYLYLSLIQNDIVERLQQIAEQSASTFPAIKPSDIGDCLVKIYAESDSNLLNNQLSSIFKEILQNNQENKHLAILRDSLLPKLMFGELDIGKIKL